MAHALVRMHPDNRPGHRLVWVHRASFAATTLVAMEGAFAVVGRHTHCTLVLPNDPFVALRHVLVRSVHLPSGGFALRVFDLHTNLGFVLADGSHQTSVFAEGPVAIAIGEYALVALPTETSDNPLPRELPSPVIDTPPEVKDQLRALAEAMSPYRAGSPPLHQSRLTLMPRPVMVGERTLASVDRLMGAQYALRLERGGKVASIMLTGADLARGVIIGRSEKCHSEILRRITDKGTSRTHLLLLAEGPFVYAYDLASTQGTWTCGQPVRRAALHDAGAVLYLGTHDPVCLSWQRRA